MWFNYYSKGWFICEIMFRPMEVNLFRIICFIYQDIYIFLISTAQFNKILWAPNYRVQKTVLVSKEFPRKFVVQIIGLSMFSSVNTQIVNLHSFAVPSSVLEYMNMKEKLQWVNLVPNRFLTSFMKSIAWLLMILFIRMLKFLKTTLMVWRILLKTFM